MQRVHIAIIKDNNTVPTVLTIPDNPTNGDVIKALFPNFKFNEEWKATRHFELQSEQDHIEITGIATSDWWNAPYKPQKSEDKDSKENKENDKDLWERMTDDYMK